MAGKFEQDKPTVDDLVNQAIFGVESGEGLGDELQDIRSAHGEDVANEVEQRLTEMDEEETK